MPMRTASESAAPAASATIARLSRQRRVWSPIEPSTSLPVSGSTGVWPLRNASPFETTACEYGPAAGGPGSAVTVFLWWDMRATYRHGQQARRRDLPLPPPARGEPRRLVPVG